MAFTVRVPARAGCSGYGLAGEAHTTETRGDAISFAEAYERRFGLSVEVADSGGVVVWASGRGSGTHAVHGARRPTAEEVITPPLQANRRAKRK